MVKKKYKQPRYKGQESKRKFRGFGFYIMSNDKLSKKNRDRLLRESEIHLGDVIKSLKGTTDELINQGVISELDSSFSDIELLDQWNNMYDSYGYLMSEFKEKWEKEKMKGYSDSPFKLSNEFEELQERVRVLENQVMELRVKLMTSPKRYTDMG
jgi:hypothetical protein